MEPNLDDLFRPNRFRLMPVLVILGLCIFGTWMLWPSSHPHRTLRPAPPAVKRAASPLYVTVVPEESGWCCVAGKVAAASRSACQGTFFAREEEAKRQCPTAPSGSPRGRGRGA